MRNGSGTYIPPTNSWSPAVNGNPATAADWQSVLNDLSSALTQSVSRDGQAPLTGNLPAGGNKITGLAAGTTAGDSVRYEQAALLGAAANFSSVTSTGDISSSTNIAATGNVTAGGTVAATGAVTGASVTTTGAVNVGTNLVATGNVSGINLTGSGVLTTAGLKEVSGNLGLNVATPIYKIDAADSAGSFFRYTRGVDQVGCYISSNVVFLGTLTNTPFAIVTNGVERGRVDQTTGNLTYTNAITASSFSGAGTGLTGTAASLAVGSLSTASGAAPSYAARAYVKFNGTGTPAIIKGRNVASITDNGVGDYTINFTTEMPDADYTMVATCRNQATGAVTAITVNEHFDTAPTTTACRISVDQGNTFIDVTSISVAFFD